MMAGAAILGNAPAEAESLHELLLALVRRPGSELLIRGTHDRRVGEVGYLRQALEQSPLRGHYMLEVRRKGGQKARQACLSVRYTSVDIQPPRRAIIWSALPSRRCLCR